MLRFTVHRPGHRRASLRSPGVSRRDVASRVQVGVRGVAAEPADEARLARATPQSLAATADNLAALSGLTADNPRRQATFAQLRHRCMTSWPSWPKPSRGAVPRGSPPPSPSC